jgi:glucokinase
MTKLIADIGATNARFAFVRDDKLEQVKVLNCADYPTLADAVISYLSKTDVRPDDAIFAIATSLDGSDNVVMTNHDWTFSIQETAQKIGIKHLRVINDFTALAYAIPHLDEKDRLQVGQGTAVAHMPIGIIGPGSGLGVAAVVFSGTRPVPVTTEGGHVTIPATSAREFSLFEFLRRSKYHHISAERILSGKGIVNVYNAIREVDGLSLPERTAEEITKDALDKTCPVCIETLDLFCHFLGVVAGNLALTYGAFGGIYIAGGIVPRFLDFFKTSRFRESFVSKGRFRDYMERIPTFVITHPYPGLVGLKNLAQKARR